MTNIKAAVLGGFVALLGVIAGEGLAHADCDYPDVPATAHEAEQGYPDCEAQSIYETAFALAEQDCDYMSQGWLESGLTEKQVEGMYEACMRLSVPPMVLSPAQHYDTTDGAFWRTTEGN